MLVARKIGGVTEFEGVCTAGEIVKDAVYVSGPAIGGLLQVRKADITDVSKMPSIGLVKRKISETRCVVQVQGPLSIGGLLPGKRYFINASGSISPIPPPAGLSAQVVQEIGKAFSEDILFVNPQTVVRIN